MTTERRRHTRCPMVAPAEQWTAEEIAAPVSRWTEGERRLLLQVVEHAIGYDLFSDYHEELMRLRAELAVP